MKITERNNGNNCSISNECDHTPLPVSQLPELFILELNKYLKKNLELNM